MNSSDVNDYLIRKFNEQGPYYTSYPTLSQWTPVLSSEDYDSAMIQLADNATDQPSTLYVHFPFCPKLCYYCICNSIITHDRARIREFLEHLFMQIDSIEAYFAKSGTSPNITEIHLGGGSPSFMSEQEFILLADKLQFLAGKSSIREYSIELDPRTVTKEKLDLYKSHGISRLSFGIQDVDPEVQKAINREHSFEFLQSLFTPDIRNDFPNINFDLLYGLPLQTRASFRRTVELIKLLSPDRITLLKYAHIPETRKHQQLLDKYPLPDETALTWMFYDAVESFQADGWIHIGIDHFAKPSNNLATASLSNTLTRNFIGFTPSFSKNILGVGPTATSQLSDFYFQSVYSLDDYYKSVSRGVPPIYRGFKLQKDDLIRRHVIFSILCNREIDINIVEAKFSLNFNHYFQDELDRLQVFINDKMLAISSNKIIVMPPGYLFLRHIARTFDGYYGHTKQYKIIGP